MRQIALTQVEGVGSWESFSDAVIPSIPGRGMSQSHLFRQRSGLGACRTFEKLSSYVRVVLAPAGISGCFERLREEGHSVSTRAT